MVVQHNLMAMNSNRMLGITTKTVAGSTEKLSSGYKINRAADNAAGLSISEKMRKQIRGLTQASANAEDGISAVQTAEGALQEVTDMLQRMNELAVQAANGTNSTTDRGYVQDEIDQLVTEIDRVAETTKFNEMYLLKGDETATTRKTYIANYAVTYTQNLGSNKTNVEKKVDYISADNIYMVSTSIAKAASSAPLTADVISNGTDVTKYFTGGTDVTVGPNGTIIGAKANLDASTSYVAFKNAELDVDKYTYTPATNLITDATNSTFILNTKTNEITRVAAGQDLSDYLQNVETIDATGKVKFAEMKDEYRILQKVGGGSGVATETTTAYDVTANALQEADFKANESMKTLYDADGNEVSGIALNQYLDENGNYKEGLYADSQATKAINNTVDDPLNISKYITKNTAEVAADLSFKLHVGADSARTNKIEATIQAMSAAALGINKLKSTSVGIVDDSGENATDAIDTIAAAIQLVSTQRSALGAVQNRLEHTIKNLDNIVENTQSAESAIRDTDMAEEMVLYANSNILAQAGQSMLAQANQANQGILSLLG